MLIGRPAMRASHARRGGTCVSGACHSIWARSFSKPARGRGWVRRDFAPIGQTKPERGRDGGSWPARPLSEALPYRAGPAGQDRRSGGGHSGGSAPRRDASGRAVDGQGMERDFQPAGRFFGLRSDQQIRRGAHRLTTQLDSAITDDIQARTAETEPFRRTKTANHTLVCVVRSAAALLRLGPDARRDLWDRSLKSPHRHGGGAGWQGRGALHRGLTWPCPCPASRPARPCQVRTRRSARHALRRRAAARARR